MIVDASEYASSVIFGPAIGECARHPRLLRMPFDGVANGLTVQKLVSFSNRMGYPVRQEGSTTFVELTAFLMRMMITGGFDSLYTCEGSAVGQ